ncbi:MAG: hypothetical protein LIP01_11805 [Tannerellaceae bacterium]|nr:hypothetical protein [Tannerellaceae bacterium]
MKFITVPEDKDVKTFLTEVKQDLINRGLKPANEPGSPTSEGEALKELAEDWMKDCVVD